MLDQQLLGQARLAVKQARTKQAFLAWGGGRLGLHPEGRGIGGELGYTNLLGLLPLPLAGVDMGGPRKGFQMGVTPDTDSEFGVSPYFGLRWNHPRRTGLTRSFPRGLPEVIYDKLRGRTKEDAMRASYPEWFEEEPPTEDIADKPEASARSVSGKEKAEKLKAKPAQKTKANEKVRSGKEKAAATPNLGSPSVTPRTLFGGYGGLNPAKFYNPGLHRGPITPCKLLPLSRRPAGAVPLEIEEGRRRVAEKGWVWDRTRKLWIPPAVSSPGIPAAGMPRPQPGAS